MAITPFRPTTDLLGSLTEDLFGSAWGGRLAGMDMLRAPAAAVAETKDNIDVVLELPGLRPEDVELSLENNILTISGEKTEDGEVPHARATQPARPPRRRRSAPGKAVREGVGGKAGGQ
jgi:HSP20 family protein